jgi:hypothetical protein
MILKQRITYMQEQTAVLVKHKDKWILFTDNDERIWLDINVAILQLQQEGWEIVQDSTKIKLLTAEIDRFHMWGYILKRNT